MMGGFGMGGYGVIFWLLVIGAGIWALTAATQARGSADSARKVLDERLARGDLSVEEYRKLRAEL